LLAASSRAFREPACHRRGKQVLQPDAGRSRPAGGLFRIRKHRARSSQLHFFRVLSSQKSGVFFAPAEPMRQPLPSFSAFGRVVLIVLGIALSAISTCAQATSPAPNPWTDAAHSLAEKIVSAVTTAHSLAITSVTDVSAKAPVDIVWLRHSVESEITTEGGRLVQPAEGSASPAAADAQVQIAVSHNVKGYLLVANIAIGGSTQMVVAPVAVTQPAPGPPGAAPLLQRKIVWQQADPIIDFAEGSPDSTHTLWYILQPDRLSAYEFSGASQILRVDQQFSLLYTSRDSRGRLALTDPTHVTAWVGKLGVRSHAQFLHRCSHFVGGHRDALSALLFRGISTRRERRKGVRLDNDRSEWESAPFFRFVGTFLGVFWLGQRHCFSQLHVRAFLASAGHRARRLDRVRSNSALPNFKSPGDCCRRADALSRPDSKPLAIFGRPVGPRGIPQFANGDV
jgi:hypothetical protein